MWFFISLVGYILLALVFVLDKIILTKKENNPAIYTFYSTIFMFGVFLGLPFAKEIIIGRDWFFVVISGLSFGFALWTMFKAVSVSEASHINPFNGAAVTVITFLLSYVFLGERLNLWQIIGTIILVISAFLFSFEKTESKFGIHVGYFWAAVSGLFYAMSHVSAKYLFDKYDFVTVLVWTKAAVGLVGLITIFFPSVQKILFAGKSRRKSEQEKKHVRKNFALIIINKTAAVLAVILIQFAIAIGSVTLVNAMSGIQYAAMFIMIVLMTKFFPKIIKEYFTKKEFITELTAIILIIIGSFFLTF